MFRRRNRVIPVGAAKLNSVMPGAGGNSCLERYEYAKHGVCFGFDPDAYFGTMVRMNQEVKSSPLGQFLSDNYGKTVNRSDFDDAVGKAGEREYQSRQADLQR
jgi:ribonuclease I